MLLDSYTEIGYRFWITLVEPLSSLISDITTCFQAIVRCQTDHSMGKYLRLGYWEIACKTDLQVTQLKALLRSIEMQIIFGHKSSNEIALRWGTVHRP